MVVVVVVVAVAAASGGCGGGGASGGGSGSDELSRSRIVDVLLCSLRALKKAIMKLAVHNASRERLS